ncbi:MAG: GerW family sporulation protein [Candidatus Ventricola sp.]|nr:GerW family sporulation protein [Candidatus Ventricola sp.]
MEKHPIESLMGTSMESIREMVDVNTVVGDPVQTQDGSTIIPISKVSFGFVAGGGEYLCGTMRPQTEEMPFAGGAGAGVSVHPMGFLVCSQNGVRLLSANCASPMERIVEMIPQALEGLKAMGEEEDTQRKPSQQVRAAYQE